MTNYEQLVKALRCCAENFGCPIECPRYAPVDEGIRACVSRLEKDAAAAIEHLMRVHWQDEALIEADEDAIKALEAEVEKYKTAWVNLAKYVEAQDANK